MNLNSFATEFQDYSRVEKGGPILLSTFGRWTVEKRPTEYSIEDPEAARCAAVSVQTAMQSQKEKAARKILNEFEKWGGAHRRPVERESGAAHVA